MQRKILILSGPTHEYIDPVRFISNASSGKMGKAIAEEAATRGSEIEFVTGPVPEANLPDLGAGRIHQVTGAEEMLTRAQELAPAANAVIFAAAVADYTPAKPLPEKMAKTNKEIQLHLRPTPDIAKTVCSVKSSAQVAIGFALQTHDGEAKARRKLENKHLDGIVLNTPATLGAAAGTFSFLSRDAGGFDEWGCIDKATCARKILDALEQLSAMT